MSITVDLERGLIHVDDRIYPCTATQQPNQCIVPVGESDWHLSVVWGPATYSDNYDVFLGLESAEEVATLFTSPLDPTDLEHVEVVLCDRQGIVNLNGKQAVFGYVTDVDLNEMVAEAVYTVAFLANLERRLDQ